MADWISAEEAEALSGYHIDTIYFHCRLQESFRAEKRGAWWNDRKSFLEFLEQQRTSGDRRWRREHDQPPGVH
jgi:hypothetical protein